MSPRPVSKDMRIAVALFAVYQKGRIDGEVMHFDEAGSPPVLLDALASPSVKFSSLDPSDRGRWLRFARNLADTLKLV